MRIYRFIINAFIAIVFMALAIVPLAVSNTAFAQGKKDSKDYRPLGKNDYKRILPGKTITGEYRFMRRRTQTFRFEERHNQDGTTDYKEGPIKSKGIWYALGEHKICYKYLNDKDMGSGTSCFWVYNSEGCYYGYSITEMTLKGPRNFDDWSARWIIKGDKGSCNIPLS